MTLLHHGDLCYWQCLPVTVASLSSLVDTGREGMLGGGCMRELQGRGGVSDHGAKVCAQIS